MTTPCTRAWVLLAALGWAQPSVAQPDATDGSDGTAPEEADGGETSETERRAQIHFEAGSNHYDAGNYEAAAQEFAASYELSGRSALLYNLYLVSERLGKLEEALDYLKRYLAEVRIDEEERVELLARRRDNLERRIAEAKSAQADTAETTPQTTQADEGGAPLGAIVSLAAAGLGLASFAVFAGLSTAEDNSLADECGTDAGAVCTGSDVSKLETYNLIADISLGVGLAAAVTGVILWIVQGRGADKGEARSATEKTVTVGPWAQPRAAGASTEVTF